MGIFHTMPRIVIFQSEFTTTILNSPHKVGVIPGRSYRHENLIQAFLPGEPIGYWQREGASIEVLKPYPVEMTVRVSNPKVTITHLSVEGQTVPHERVSLVRPDSQELTSRHKELVDVERLQRATAIIFGLGTVGTLAVEQLVRTGMRRFILMDRDWVEPSNLSRTTFQWHDIGRSKAEAMAEHLRAIYPTVKVTALHKKVGELSTVEMKRLIHQGNIALIAIDDVIEQIRLSRQLSQQMPVVVAVIEPGGGGGEITFLTSQTKPFCCVTNVKERLNAAPQGVSGAQALLSDVFTVVSTTVNVMLQLLHHNTPCARFPEPLHPNENVILVGRGDTGGMMQGNLRTKGPISGVFVNTSRWRSPCPYCGTFE